MSVLFSKDDSKVFSLSDDRTLRFWSVENGDVLLKINAHDAYVRAMTISPDGSLIASGMAQLSE